MKYEIRSRGLLWGFFRDVFGLSVQGFPSLIGGNPLFLFLDEKKQKSRLSNLWLKLQSRGAQTEPLRFASLLHFASSPLLCNFFTPNLLRPVLQYGSAEFGFCPQGLPSLIDGTGLVLSQQLERTKEPRLQNLWRERLRIGAQSEAIALRSTSTLCFFTNPLSFFYAKSSEAGLLNGSAKSFKNEFFLPIFLIADLLSGSANELTKKVLLGCDVSYRQHDEGFYGAKQTHSIIQFLKRLWSTYRENQSNRKEVQRRLLRKRAFGKRKASLDIKTYSLKLKSFVWVVFFIVSNLKLDAQELKALKVGEQMPDVMFGNLLGFGQQEVRFSDLRGKVVLIDFWSNYCGSCIGGMAHLQDLKNNLKDSVVVLPVNAETKERIVKLWANNPTLKKLPIYTIYGDKTLAQLFPHEFFPHLVWIGKDGKYLGASSAEYANDKEVRNVYGGGAVSWEEKKDVDLFNPKVVALHKFLKQDTDDYFLPYLRGMSNQSGVVLQADSMLRYYVVNTQMANQYAIASESLGMAYLPKRRVLQLKDSMAYAYQKDYGYSEAWREKYGFSYERVFAKGTSKAQMYALMLQDLNAHYGLEGKMVNEPVAVLALRKNGSLLVDDAKTPKTKLRFWIAGINQIAGLAWVVNDTGLDEQTLMPVLPENLNKNNIDDYVKKMGLALEPSVNAIPMFHLKLKP
jgi:thiol-disulfide isomerase/thioredoxin